MEGYQQLFALIKNPKYVKMNPPENRAVIRIEQYCKRRKDRMKPKWQEDSSCVFASYFCRGTCQRRDTAGKERAQKSLRRRSGKRSFAKAVRTIRQENRQGRGKLPPLYAAVRVRRRSYGVSYILRSVAGRITGHRRSLPQPSSAAWCPRLLTRAEAKASTPQRTDLAQVKRGRHTGRPRKARSTKAFPPAAVYPFCGDTPEMALLANG